jgi:hypothetical protein
MSLPTGFAAKDVAFCTSAHEPDVSGGKFYKTE